MRVQELVPGMRFQVLGSDGLATFVAETQHPLWPLLRLVVWRMPDGGWSHDALSPLQEVGMPEHSTAGERVQSLRVALLSEAAR